MMSMVSMAVVVVSVAMRQRTHATVEDATVEDATVEDATVDDATVEDAPRRWKMRRWKMRRFTPCPSWPFHAVLPVLASSVERLELIMVMPA